MLYQKLIMVKMMINDDRDDGDVCCEHLTHQKEEEVTITVEVRMTQSQKQEVM